MVEKLPYLYNFLCLPPNTEHLIHTHTHTHRTFVFSSNFIRMSLPILLGAGERFYLPDARWCRVDACAMMTSEGISLTAKEIKMKIVRVYCL